MISREAATVSLQNKALLTCPSGEAQAIFQHGLASAGFESVSSYAAVGEVVTLIERLSPDIAVGLFPDSGELTLKALAKLPRERRCPTVMFVARATNQTIRIAVEAGVGAYVVDGFAPSRVTPAIMLALSRFQTQRRLEDDLAQARNAVAERKLVERAKGILMQARG